MCCQAVGTCAYGVNFNALDGTSDESDAGYSADTQLTGKGGPEASRCVGTMRVWRQVIKHSSRQTLIVWLVMEHNQTGDSSTMADQTGSAHRHVLLSFHMHALKLSDSPLTSLSFAPSCHQRL